MEVMKYFGWLLLLGIFLLELFPSYSVSTRRRKAAIEQLKSTTSTALNGAHEFRGDQMEILSLRDTSGDDMCDSKHLVYSCEMFLRDPNGRYFFYIHNDGEKPYIKEISEERARLALA